MKVISIKNVQYYEAENVKDEYPEMFKRCNKIRNIVFVQKLTKDDYIYAYKRDDKWHVSDKDYSKAKILLTKSCVEKLKNKLDEDLAEDESESSSDEEDEIKVAPKILKLKDSEKFKDAGGNVIEIEVRGEKKYNKCYFKVADASKCFGMPDLCRTLINPKSAYEIDKDYVRFNVSGNDEVYDTTGKNSKNGKNGKKNKNSRKYVFLTYNGLMRALYVSRSKSANHFQEWASKILFTVQMGSIESKQKLAADILGCTYKEVKNVLSKIPVKISCIYLMTLGTVEQLREKMNIPAMFEDDEFVCRYGRSEDLLRRMEEHTINYKKILDVDVKLKKLVFIDPLYNSSAEKDIKDTFRLLHVEFKYKTESELVILEKSQMNKEVTDYFSKAGKLYGGIVSNVNAQLTELLAREKISLLEKDIKIQQLNEECGLLKKDLIIHQLKSDQEISKKDQEISKKDQEISKKDQEIFKKDQEISKQNLVIKRLKNNRNKKTDNSDSDSD
jgi:hypothetical protein